MMHPTRVGLEARGIAGAGEHIAAARHGQQRERRQAEKRHVVNLAG